jgi:hypothetical protein
LTQKLSELSVTDIKSFRLLVFASVSTDTGHPLVISALKKMKENIQDHLFLDLLFEIGAKAPSLIEECVFARLTSEIDDDRLKQGSQTRGPRVACVRPANISKTDKIINHI